MDLNYYNLFFLSQFFCSSFRNALLRERTNNFINDSLRNAPEFYSSNELMKLLSEVFVKYNHYELQSHVNEFVNRHDEKGIDFYRALFEFADGMIRRSDNKYCFRYEYTDIWKNTVSLIGEEIFVIAAVVCEDIRRREHERNDMDWSFCISSDNHDIKVMLRRDDGVSENHFHLRGSSPYFDASWIYLMNDILNADFDDNIKKIENDHLNEFRHHKADYSLQLIWRKAAAIRLFLYMVVSDKFDISHIDSYINGTYDHENASPGERRAADFCCLFFKRVVPFDSDSLTDFPVRELHSITNSMIQEGCIDYAQEEYSVTSNVKYTTVFGERKLIYKCLRMIKREDNGYKLVKSLLYLYFLFKDHFHAELVQTNSDVGFYNFLSYQNRKDYFIPERHEETLAYETICSVLEEGKINKVELRISPWSPSDKMAGLISSYDSAIERAYRLMTDNSDGFRDHFFYTIQFPKYGVVEENKRPRFNMFRERLETNAMMLLDLNEETASRIYGIDACGDEMNCRPEVFAVTFRKLTGYESRKTDKKNREFHQLKMTYHAGEDNYDLLDGIRAIWEAVTFLEYHSGCRIGHGTFLGLETYNFYEKLKKNPVAMPRQVFLDNLVWIYYFIQENNIDFEGCVKVNEYVFEKFREHFHYIFSDTIRQTKTEHILERFREEYDSSLSFDALMFDMNEYYMSYLLRGDEPSFYQEGYIIRGISSCDAFNICSGHEKMEKARKSFAAGYMYHLYHYDDGVKRRGNESIKESLPEYMLTAIHSVQKKLRRIISEKGIAIETNPSSNCFISIIDDYSEHPVTTFYDNALTDSGNDVQLNVSVNTDDKSVFSTNLCNEYAYLLFYLENKKNEKHETVYSRFQIMKWLDEIRKMGNEQSFAG